MNRLFKASAMLAILAASAIIMSCSGSDGKNGGPGVAGDSCELKANSDGNPAIYCGGTQIFVLDNNRTGSVGESGEPGAGCRLQVQSEGVWDVICGSAKLGEIRESEEITSGQACSLLDLNAGENDSLIVKCGSDRFSISLCEGRTFDVNKQFCSNGSLASRCNGEVYVKAYQYCARNLIIGVKYEYVGSELRAVYEDVDTTNSNSDNWKIMPLKRPGNGVLGDADYRPEVKADSCFAAAPGVNIVKACSEHDFDDLLPPIKTSTDTSFYVMGRKMNGGINLNVDDPTVEIPAFESLISYPVKWSAGGVPTLQAVNRTCGVNRFFDISKLECTSASVAGDGITTGSAAPFTANNWATFDLDNYETFGNIVKHAENGCKVIMSNANTCYSVAKEAPSANIFAKSCVLKDFLINDGGVGTQTGVTAMVQIAKIFYDPATVSDCDDRRTYEAGGIRQGLAIAFSKYCVGNRIFNTEHGTNGQAFYNKVKCLTVSDPVTCPIGSGYDEVVKLCVMEDDYKKPSCLAANYKRASESDFLDAESSTGTNPLNYCVRDIDGTMCPLRTIPGTGTDLGYCVTDPEYTAVPTIGVYTEKETNRFVYRLTASSPGVCNSGYVYNTTNSKCELNDKAPKCPINYTIADTTIAGVKNFYCIYAPKQTECDPYFTYNSTDGVCYPQADQGEEVDKNKAREPNCPHGIGYYLSSRLCAELLTSAHCPFGSTLRFNTEENAATPYECNPSEPTPRCPSYVINGVSSSPNPDGNNCYLDFERACPLYNTSVVSYIHDGSGGCRLDNRRDVVCPIQLDSLGNTLGQQGYNTTFGKCAVPITRNHCPMNIENTLATTRDDYWPGAGSLLVARSDINMYGFSRQEGTETVDVRECRFSQTGTTVDVNPGLGILIDGRYSLLYNSSLCTGGKNPDARTGRCEDYIPE